MATLKIQTAEKNVVLNRSALKGVEKDMLIAANDLMKSFNCKRNKFYSDTFDIEDINGFANELSKLNFPGVIVEHRTKDQQRADMIEKMNANNGPATCPDCGRVMEQERGNAYCEYCEG